ncbi:MAG: cation acetate symporter, partial [Desulfuromonadaceae bacterium]
MSLFFILMASNVFAAENLNLNDGKVRVFPAILMISLLILFILVGVFSKAKDTEDYWAAGRGVGQIGGGMAIASNWMSAASYLGMAG